jgi:hypothetical protein
MKNINSVSRKMPGSIALLVIIAVAAFVAVLATGCASQRPSKNEPNDEPIATTPPSFLIGSASALLINTNGFSTRLTVELPDASAKVHSLSGELLCQGSRLLFAPTGGDRIFVWDVKQQSGFVVSEALQGYAPISSSVQITNVDSISDTPVGVENKVNGHPGHEAKVAVASNDGSKATFSVWCAADLDDFPVRIKSLNTSEPFDVNLHDIRIETIAPKLFLPPEDFTQYSSPEAMSGELAMRKSKIHAKITEHQFEAIPFPSMPGPSTQIPGVH